MNEAAQPTTGGSPVRDTDPHVAPALYITADVPGTGGAIKQRPEDFLVDETAAYQPSGEGDHLYLFVEKRNLSTLEAARVLAGHFGVPPDSVGFAGMKDRVAITRQLFSVYAPGKKPEDFQGWSTIGCRSSGPTGTRTRFGWAT